MSEIALRQAEIFRAKLIEVQALRELGILLREEQAKLPGLLHRVRKAGAGTLPVHLPELLNSVLLL